MCESELEWVASPSDVLFGDLICLPCRRKTMRKAFEQGLADFYTVRLVVGYHTGVVLPAEIQTPAWKSDQEPVVHLDYGLDMEVPIIDMVVDDLGVSATLSFARSPFQTRVPWEAVVTMGAGKKRPPERPKLGLVP
jgi:hypothetical protein